MSSGTSQLGGRGERGENKGIGWSGGGLEGKQDRTGAWQSHVWVSWSREFVGSAGVRGLGCIHCSPPSCLCHLFICKLGPDQSLPPGVDVRAKEVRNGSTQRCAWRVAGVRELSCPRVLGTTSLFRGARQVWGGALAAFPPTRKSIQLPRNWEPRG